MAALALIPLLAGAQNNNSGSLCPDSNHPHVIDLGLPSNTKWACCNVGSMKPEDYGSYFAWGETSPKSRYDWSNYSWCRFSGNSKMLTKYNPKPPCGTVDNRTQLELSDDAAHVNWHGSWRMPTLAEIKELADGCRYAWTTVNGVKGGKFTSRYNGRSIFLPATGSFNGYSLYHSGTDAVYWSSSLDMQDPYSAHFLSFHWTNAASYRDLGRSVRPVLSQPVQHTDIPLCPDGNHPHVIDLGLPSGTKWACCNVGGSKPEDYGSYFAWGETSTKGSFDWSNYRWCKGANNNMTKYNLEYSFGTVDNCNRLELSDDAARANWHGSWRMPTLAELEELKANCSYTWTTVNGVKGGKFTSRSNGRSIFLPAAGFRGKYSLHDRDEAGDYWSSSLREIIPNGAHELRFISRWADTGHSSRDVGQSVRPVFGK